MRSLDLNKEKSIQAPDSWKFGKLSDIALIAMGQSPPGDTYNSENKGIPMLNGPTEFTDYYPIPIQFTTRPTKISKPGDILYCVRGSSTGRMNFSDREYCIGRGLASIRQKANSNTKYIYYILTQVTKRIFAEAKGAGSTFPNISRKGLEKTNILIPPIDEQHKIAEILSTVDADIEKTDAIIKETQQLKKGLMEKLFTEGIGHTRFKETKIGRIPEDWQVVKIKNVAETSSGGTPSRNNKEYFKGGTPWVKTGELTNKYLKKTEECISKLAIKNSSAKVFSKGTILMAMYGATIGKMSILNVDASCNQACCSIIPDKSKGSTEYIYYALEYRKPLLISMGSGGAQPNISQQIIKVFEIPLPEIAKQEKIANVLYEVDTKIENEQNYKLEMKQLKKGLLQVLLTGKVRVKV